jgi:hypothetical protein
MLSVSSFQLFNELTNLHKIWHECYAIGNHLTAVYFTYSHSERAAWQHMNL